MRVYRTTEETLMLELSELELLTFASCIREAFAYMSREDFPVRIGVSLDRAAAIASELNSLLRDVGLEQ